MLIAKERKGSNMKSNPVVRFRNLSIPLSERKTILKEIDKLMESGELILGDSVLSFEKEFADFCQRKFTVGVSNGTAALYLALRAHGIGAGDEVITTPMSWVATSNAILALGAHPVFCDIGEDFNIRADQMKRLLSPKTKAIVPVHYFGRISSMPEIMDFANENSLVVVEDAAQSAGASYKSLKSGSFGDSAAFSLNPMKPLAALGEAGAIVTDNEEIYEKLLSLRYLGTINRETCIDPSLNYKIDSLQALILSIRLKDLPAKIQERNFIASFYSRNLPKEIITPQPPDDGISTFFDYTIRVANRDKLEEFMLRKGIEVRVKHRLLIPDHPGYVKFANANIPNARKIVSEMLSLPIYAGMSESDQTKVIEIIHEFTEKSNS